MDSGDGLRLLTPVAGRLVPLAIRPAVPPGRTAPGRMAKGTSFSQACAGPRLLLLRVPGAPLDLAPPDFRGS